MSHNEFEKIAFDLPKNKSNVIKVIGVGGGGSNAINHMFQQGIRGVDFVICNTDAQALQNSGVPNKIQLGVNLTEGLGAGANPDVGMQSAVESIEDIKTMLSTNTKMIFITAGMGGGTGTGAAPIIAKMARDLDILTVGIVTMPFQFEGKMRVEQAQEGVEKLRKEVDSLIVINNNKLREVYGNLGFKAGFSKADEVLSTAAKGIAEVITHHYTQNIDLRDAKTVLSNSGTAIMGSATSSGQNRAQEAITKALDSPLLNDNKITGAKNVLLLIVSGTQEITIDEIGEINDHIQTEAGHGANIIMGVGEDESLEESIAVTIIATGFNVEQQDEISNTETKKVIHALEEDQSIQKDLSTYKPTTIKPEETIQKPEHINIVKHTLDINEETEDQLSEQQIKKVNNQNNNLETLDIIPTTQVIKDIAVVYEEIIETLNNQEDFIITPVETNKENTIKEEENEAEKQQITLSFDMPINSKNDDGIIIENEEKPIIYDLTNEVNEIEVNDHIEVLPEIKNEDEDENEEIRYTLQDEEENTEKTSNEIEIPDTEVVFEKKVITEEENIENKSEENLNPTNSSISDILKERADSRRKKMKSFNYKFNNSKIDDIEKVPAYKRQGMTLDETQPSTSETNISKTSLSIDDNDDIQIRKNNKYLHDNVD